VCSRAWDRLKAELRAVANRVGTEFGLASLAPGWLGFALFDLRGSLVMARICELTGKGPIKGSRIWRSGKPKREGGIGTHITAITKRRFFPNLQRVKAIIDGEVRYIRVSTKAIKKGLVTKAPRRTWKKEAAKA
jgi:large subunit ribosomal protein L28